MEGEAEGRMKDKITVGKESKKLRRVRVVGDSCL